MKRLLCGLVALGLLVGGARRAEAQPSYVVTTIDVPGSTWTRGFGINDFGVIVGEYLDVRGTGHGFSLSGGQLHHT